MKRIGISALALVSLSCQAQQLSTFTEIAKAVSLGKKISIVVDLKQCSSQKFLPAAIFSITPNAVMVIDNTRITASDRHFTLDDPSAPGTPVFGYSKYAIDGEGEVSIKITLLKALNYEQLDSYKIKCTLNKGVNVYD